MLSRQLTLLHRCFWWKICVAYDQAQHKLRRIYDTGKWQVNFSDSSILIDFGKNDLGLLPFEGKYTSLGAGRMSLRQTISFDSLTDGKMESYIRNINTYFESY
jgi:hypothetical protein